MLVVRNHEQEIIARYTFELGPILSRDIIMCNDKFRHVLEAMRTIEPTLLAIRVCYPKISDEFIIFNPNRRKLMDLENIVEEFEAKHQAEAKVDVEAPTLYVAPQTAELPNDGVLNYVTVETLYDFKAVPDRSVVLLREDQYEMVKCIHDYRNLFNVNIVVLSGLPSANYSVAFDEATWAYDRVAYAPFISELRVAGEIEAQLATQNSTQYAKEKGQYTRKTGEVKAHTAFTVATQGSEEDDSEPDLAI